MAERAELRGNDNCGVKPRGTGSRRQDYRAPTMSSGWFNDAGRLDPEAAYLAVRNCLLIGTGASLISRGTGISVGHRVNDDVNSKGVGNVLGEAMEKVDVLPFPLPTVSIIRVEALQHHQAVLIIE